MLAGALTPAFTLMLGCLSVNVEGSWDTDEKDSRRAVRVSHPDGTHGRACDLIDESRKIGHRKDRARILAKVAKWDDLSTHEQVYLINAVCGGHHGSSEAKVLAALAKNAALTSEGRKHLTARIDSFSSKYRARILEALAENPGGPAV
jgi:hypothetical protein